MSNLLKMERYKLFHNMIFWLMLIGMTVLGFFSGSGYRQFFVAHDHDRIPIESFSGVYNAMVADSLMLMVAICALLGWYIGREFSLRTISSEVASGSRRFDIFLSKTIVYLTAYNTVMILYSLAGAVSQIGYFGAGDIANNILNILRTTIYMILLQSALFLVVITLAFVLRSGIKTAVVGPIVSFVIMLAFVETLQHELPGALLYLNPVYRFREITSMGSTLGGTGIVNVPALITAVVWIAGCSMIIWKNFAKSDLK